MSGVDQDFNNTDKANLKFGDARPTLEQGLVKRITGIF
ncbi:complement resistance protein TraT [Legionella drozanskii]|nr:complement resistance protein TraT [Legionella drozanskii]